MEDTNQEVCENEDTMQTQSAGDTWIDRIYAENRKKAAISHANFEKVGYPDKYIVVGFVVDTFGSKFRWTRN